MSIDNDSFIWDPIIARWNDRWWMYCIAHNRGVGDWAAASPLWAEAHTMYGWVSDDWQTWESLGPCIAPPRGMRLCSGCVVPDENRMLAFLGANDLVKDAWTMSQQPALYETRDGVQWDYLGQPFDCEHFPTGVLYHGKPCYACRDMAYLHHEGEHLLYVPTGGSRWNAPTTVMLMKSYTLEGPYCSAGHAAPDIHWQDHRGIGEFERISITQANDKWYMTGGCWTHWIPPEHRIACAAMGEPIEFSTLHLLEADDPHGPFRFVWDVPFIKGSSSTGQYGALLTQYDGKTIGLGWLREGVMVSPTTAFEVDWTTRQIMRGEQ